MTTEIHGSDQAEQEKRFAAEAHKPLSPIPSHSTWE